MITRDLAGLCTVQAMSPLAAVHSCTVTGFTSACGSNNMSAFGNGAISGFAIDRLALPGQYNALLVSVSGFGPIQSSATSCRLQYVGVSLGLQHAGCSTAGWVDYSTGTFVTVAGRYVSTATSTADAWWDAGLNAAIGTLTTAATTSTSTGTQALTANTVFDLTGAERFVRVIVAPRIETTGCGGYYTSLAGQAIFGHAAESPMSVAKQGKVLYSTGNSTSTST
jgi:hypothetical protein